MSVRRLDCAAVIEMELIDLDLAERPGAHILGQYWPTTLVPAPNDDAGGRSVCALRCIDGYTTPHHQSISEYIVGAAHECSLSRSYIVLFNLYAHMQLARITIVPGPQYDTGSLCLQEQPDMIKHGTDNEDLPSTKIQQGTSRHGRGPGKWLAQY
jgi:hypothetical protein